MRGLTLANSFRNRLTELPPKGGVKKRNLCGDLDLTIPTSMEGTHVEMYGRDACRDVRSGANHGT